MKPAPSIFGRIIAVAALLAAAAPAMAQRIADRPFAANVIVPQRSVISLDRGAGIEIVGVNVAIDVLEQAATTTMDIRLRNTSSRRQEAELIVPVPDGAVVRGFAFEGASSESTAQMLPRDEARRIYNEIVSRVRDPALMEFMGYNLIRSSVFPVEAGGTQKVRLIYEHLLTLDGDRIDYMIPRSESLDYRVPWKVTARIESNRPISTVYSPTHKVETEKPTDEGRKPYVVRVHLTAETATEPGPFRLSWLLQSDGVTASLYAYPDPKVGGGYFLLLAGLPADNPKSKGGPAIKREVTLALDRSGSMNGEKIKQVREAALQILAGLEPGEAFNVITYNEGVDPFSAAAVVKSDETMEQARRFLTSVQARGGTNIHDALVEALRGKPAAGMLPIVLFLTDGLPTVGQTSEAAIREVAVKANPNKRRIFTFGVGVDVNTPLLEKIAYETRATPTFVLPGENVEVKVAQVFERLAGPVLADPALEVVGKDDRPVNGRSRDLLPAPLPDLFKGDQLVVLGQYVGEDPLAFRLKGNFLGQERTFRFEFDLREATTKNAFVPRLWASRKIAVLIDAIRQLGANGDPTHVSDAARTDPRLKELVDEIVSLSTQFGILTEYTSFLAREGTNLDEMAPLAAAAGAELKSRALERSGLGGVNQAVNAKSMRSQAQLNSSNTFYDRQMRRVEVRNVQQVNDLAFYQRGGQWIDSRLVGKGAAPAPARVVEFGSEDFRRLADRLARENRQGAISLHGSVMLDVDGETVLIKGANQ